MFKHTNPTVNNITTFNKLKMWDALKYIAKLQKCSLHKLLTDNKLKSFYTAYVASSKRIPTLKQLVKVCDKLGLNVKSFVFNDNPFNAKKDFIGKATHKAQYFSPFSLEDFYIKIYRLYETFKENSDIKDNLYLIINKDKANIFYKHPISGSLLVFYFVYKNKKIYALHDRCETDINNLIKPFKSGFSLFNKALFKVYSNMLIIEHLNTFSTI